MNESELRQFRRRLEWFRTSLLPDDKLRLYLKHLFLKYEIAELTPAHRARVRKCRAPLSYVASLSDESGSVPQSIAGNMVYQASSVYFWLYCCTELNTLVSKKTFISNGVSRWRIGESSFTRIKYLTHEAAAELIVGHKDSLKVFTLWEQQQQQ
ncbi:MAG: hypothetical protein M3384_22450 [Acidobacteriota bacterium]|nr:hypothetical protein [Acidobacteriota bacterium]